MHTLSFEKLEEICTIHPGLSMENVLLLEDSVNVIIKHQFILGSLDRTIRVSENTYVRFVRFERFDHGEDHGSGWGNMLCDFKCAARNYKCNRDVIRVFETKNDALKPCTSDPLTISELRNVSVAVEDVLMVSKIISRNDPAYRVGNTNCWFFARNVFSNIVYKNKRYIRNDIYDRLQQDVQDATRRYRAIIARTVGYTLAGVLIPATVIGAIIAGPYVGTVYWSMFSANVTTISVQSATFAFFLSGMGWYNIYYIKKSEIQIRQEFIRSYEIEEDQEGHINSDQALHCV